ncbi:MdtA/MuxA family multidrug efflux RND transporter periplasmic adaptor subunit [Telmatospirillum sp.]|uniref:MdtA/MuxA family multidrug efflux RND transporter periplasmic adaptor subunit n=1 Tax=Telmatospirillum sp. TaxID=2079197 RepID=UPI00283DD681|nr:MdtA/MuxA family multidrug efflux RND transporter periplasmic adaptor subunit [Telmatospirillum sp.]MDR3437609.1 MdtA/MuxA family multidrug efflux RND transporter periplasmic adaptor subunit [Telmatospirillum sp.]
MNDVQGKDVPPGNAGWQQRSLAKSRARWRRVIWGVLIAALMGTITWVSVRPPAAPPSRPGRFGASAGPMPVVAAVAEKGDISITLGALGTVIPLATVTVKTQIAGQLTDVAYREGQVVRAGDFLAQIDPRPYQLSLAQYSGQLQRDQALLRAAEVDFARYKTLLAQDSIARQTVDTQEALVQQYRGTVETDQAQVNNAKLNLVYCHIVAPVGGRVGLRQVDPGNYVQTSDTNGIVVITQMQPITVVFTLPEDNLPAVMKRLHEGATLGVAAFDRSQSTQLASGRLMTVDNQIDTTTGTIKLKAQFDNRDEALFPNQFVNTRLLVDTLKDATVIPSAAVQRGAPGTYVYVVKDDNTVTVRPIKLGPASGEKVAILSGIEIGEKVVVDGGDKLREGASVTLPTAKDQTGAAGNGGGTPAPAAADAHPRKTEGEADTQHRRRKDQ